MKQMPSFSKICQETQNKSLTKIQTVKEVISFPSIEKKRSSFRNLLKTKTASLHPSYFLSLQI